VAQGPDKRNPIPIVIVDPSDPAITRGDLAHPLYVSDVGGAEGGGLTDVELRAADVKVSLDGEVVSVTGPLTDAQLRASAVPVSVAAGGGDGAILDGVSAAIKATVRDRTNSNPVAVELTAINGDPLAQGTGAFAADVLRVGLADGALVNVGDVQKWGGGTLNAAFASVDIFPQSYIVAPVHGFNYAYDPIGDVWVRVRGDIANGLDVDVTDKPARDLGKVDIAALDQYTPVAGRLPVDGSGVTQPVSGPLTDAQLRASAVPVSGTVTGNPTTAFGKTITYVSISQSAAGTTELAAASVGNKHKVVGMTLIMDSTGTAKLTDGVGDLTGAMAIVTNGGFVWATSIIPYTQTGATNRALNLVTATGAAKGVIAILTEP
jgi:hypothetical protein